MLKASICIPNYNYSAYLPYAIQSALDQGEFLDELIIVDNASNDDSVDTIQTYTARDKRIKLFENTSNIGFALNVREAARRAASPWIVILSSDDLLAPGALDLYDRLIVAMESCDLGSSALFSGRADVIDSKGELTAKSRPPQWLWKDADPDPTLTATAGTDVYIQPADQTLRRCLQTMRNPASFATAMFPRSTLAAVGGYRGGHLINPDKGFHWRALASVDHFVFVDSPLALYRVHDANQAEQQRRAGALKHLVDEYCYTFELEQSVLDAAGLSRSELERAFIRHDVALRGLEHVARGRRAEARRHLAFGASTYPRLLWRDKRLWQLAGLLSLGPLGTKIAKGAYRSQRDQEIGPLSVYQVGDSPR